VEQMKLGASAPQCQFRAAPHRIWHHLDAGTDACKALRLLVDPHSDAETAQGRGDGKTAHAGSDDDNREPFLAHCVAIAKP
jgi:hypothetical protein